MDLGRLLEPRSVAVVGASREDMADLKVAVNTISQRAIDFDAVRGELKGRGIVLRGGAADEAPAAYKRLDEVSANRNLNLRWTPENSAPEQLAAD